MKAIFYALGLLLSGPGLAAGAIVPTEDPGSDCVAATIATPRGAGNRKYDEAYCAVNRDPAAYRTCLKNASDIATIAFFTDRCGEAGDGVYVSFNGRTHRLARTSTVRHRYVTYAGGYSGDGGVVRVVPGKLIERFEEDGELLGVTHSVDVFITSAGETVKVPAVYDSRR